MTRRLRHPPGRPALRRLRPSGASFLSIRRDREGRGPVPAQRAFRTLRTVPTARGRSPLPAADRPTHAAQSGYLPPSRSAGRSSRDSISGTDRTHSLCSARSLSTVPGSQYDRRPAQRGQGRFWSMESTEFSIHTGHERRTVDITSQAAQFVDQRGDGLLSVFVPHATAGLAIMETGAGSDVDLMGALDELLPRDDRWRHRHGSRGHGADHLVPAFVSPSVTIPVEDGRLLLGTWQSIVLVDPNADNSERRIRLSWISG